MKFAIASLSSKGQLVIPRKFRKFMGLDRGSKLIMIADGLNLLVRAITPPETRIFSKVINKSLELLKEGSREYRAIWEALQRHSIADLYKRI